MRKLKPQSKKSKSRFRKAALVFALAGATFLAGYANWKCDRTEQKPATVETGQRNQAKNTETKAREVVTKLEKALSAAERKKAEDERKANEVLVKLTEEFPYESLDCKLMPRKPILLPVGGIEIDDMTEADRDNAFRDTWEELKGASKTVTNEVGEYSRENSRENLGRIMCKLGFLEDRISCSREEHQTELTRDIERLKEENAAEGVLSLMGYMFSLNLEREYGADYDFGSLYQTYDMMRSEARRNGFENAPTSACIARNAYALKILYAAEKALADLLPKNPGSAESVLERLPEHQRQRVLKDCAKNLFLSEDFDVARVENFFAALSPVTRTQFIAVLHPLYNVSEKRAEAVTNYTSYPELAKEMEIISMQVTF